MGKREEERTKYLATFVNSCAASSFTVCVLAPIAAAFYGAERNISVPLLPLGGFVWLFAALSLHLSVRRILRELPDD